MCDVYDVYELLSAPAVEETEENEGGVIIVLYEYFSLGVPGVHT